MASETLKLIIIGGSAGSIPPLMKLLKCLPEDFNATLILVLHRQRNTVSNLAQILSQKLSRPVIEPDDKEKLQPGRIYLAPQNYHLLVERTGTVALEYSELVRFSRPSIDVTLESAAELEHTARLGIILSGANADGTKGLEKLLAAGGKGWVQAPETAAYAVMPEEAQLANPTAEALSVEAMCGRFNTFIHTHD
ncbi:MAG: chemotaxis protein CheB [Sphingobacteriales bacterium]|nr:MAG: chemotaxis protein CheB [Sphingobacteriales bacterium]